MKTILTYLHQSSWKALKGRIVMRAFIGLTLTHLFAVAYARDGQPQAVIHTTNSIALTLNNFTHTELQGLPTFLLTNANNKNVVLLKSIQSYALFERYFPLTQSEYQVISVLSATQLQDMLQTFFTHQSVDVIVSFNAEIGSMRVTRKGHAYAPSLITWVFVGFAFIALMVLLVRRQYLQYRLHEYAQAHDADAWLRIYVKAKFPLYYLHKKWAPRASYWLRLQRESAEFSAQANTYFDAGDISTAKLFLSKALHSNVANQQAKKIMKAIVSSEANAKALSENEQWIRNKIAKAMNNYRQQIPTKALRQLYQAYERARSVKGLKKQVKAIKKLIKNMIQEHSRDCHSLVLNCSSDPSSIVVCQNDTVHIGRLPSNGDLPWVSSQDAVFYINHKLVSRITHHAYISRTAHGFEVVDVGSKNGTYLNGKLCDEQFSIPMQNKDMLQLGTAQSISAVTLNIDVSETQDILLLSFVGPPERLVDRREFNQIWPDNALAVRTKLACVKQSFILAYDQEHHQICLLSANTNNTNIECQNQPTTASIHQNDVEISEPALPRVNFNKETTSQFIFLCLIHLGERASIKPFNGDIQINIDNEALLGEVPLLLPCNIECGEVNVQLTEYNSSSVRYSDDGLLSMGR